MGSLLYVCVLSYTGQPRPEHSTTGTVLIKVEVSSLDLLATFLLLQSRILGARFFFFFFLNQKGTLLAHMPGAHQDTHIFLYKTSFQLSGPQHTMVDSYSSPGVELCTSC